MNRVIIIGNLCADPQLKSTAAGIPVCGFTLAADRRGKAEARRKSLYSVSAM